MADQWNKLKDGVTVAGGACAIVLGLAAGAAWLTGGLKPGVQIQSEQIQASVDRLARQVSEIAGKIDTMPRPSDYAAIDAHFAKIDAALDTLRSRMDKADVDAATLRTKVDRLDGTPLRTPRN